MAWIWFKRKHSHNLKCVGVDHEKMPVGVFGAGGRYTHALLRCDTCGYVTVHTLRGSFTVEQVNGVTDAALAEALIAASTEGGRS